MHDLDYFDIIDTLATTGVRLRNEKIQAKAIDEYNKIMQETLKEQFYNAKFQVDVIQIEGSNLDWVTNRNVQPKVEIEDKNYTLLKDDKNGIQTIVGKADGNIESIDYEEVENNVWLIIKTTDGKENVVWRISFHNIKRGISNLITMGVLETLNEKSFISSDCYNTDCMFYDNDSYLLIEISEKEIIVCKECLEDLKKVWYVDQWTIL